MRSRHRVVDTDRPTSRWRDERGQIGGLEALPFGILLFVSVLLVVTNAWAVIDAKLATSSAAREGARAYVESDNGADAFIQSQQRAHEALRSYGRDGDRASVEVTGDVFGRCATIIVIVTYRVPALTVPFIGGFGSGITARSTHVEIVDPYRSGLPEGGCF